MLKKVMLILLALGVLVVAGFLGCSGPAPAPAPAPAPTPAPAPGATTKVIELKFAHTLPPVTPKATDEFADWAKRVEAMSNGRVKITLFPSESLIAGRDSYPQLLAGTCDITEINPDWFTGVFPLTEGVGLPFLFNSCEAGSATFHELIDKYLKNAEYKEVKTFVTAAAGITQMFTRNKPIQTLQDLAGVKIGTAAGTLTLKALQMLGASAVFMPVAESYTNLQTGVVDGQVEGWSTLRTFKTMEVTKYRTRANISNPAGVLAMNLKTWNSLPPDIQQIFNQVSGVDQSRLYGHIQDAYNIWCLEQVVVPYDKQKGNADVYTLPDAELAKWRQAVTPLYESWIAEKEAKGLPAKAFFNDLKTIAEKYNQAGVPKAPPAPAAAPTPPSK